MWLWLSIANIIYFDAVAIAVVDAAAAAAEKVTMDRSQCIEWWRKNKVKEKQEMRWTTL